MPTVGEQLRKAREARQLRIQEVAAATKMRSDHIIALEEGDYAPFPAPVYVRGSVRTYAKLLNLDVMPIMEALTAELEAAQGIDQTRQSTLPRRGVVEFAAYQLSRFGWKRSVVVLLIVLGIAILLLIRLSLSATTTEDPLSDLPPATYEPAGSEDGYLPLPETTE